MSHSRIRHSDVVWTEGDESWTGRVGRYHVAIWLFGPRYQCKVVIEYQHARSRSTLTDAPTVGVGLPISEDLDDAKILGLAWINEFEARGLPSAEAVVSEIFEAWMDLYQYRHEVLTTLFLRSGNGYDWLDGCVVNKCPYDYLEVGESALDVSLRKSAAEWDEMYKKYPELGPLPDFLRPKPVRTVGPHPDDGRPLKLGTPSDYSQLANVPPDVTDDWLQLAFESAEMLRDRAIEAPAREYGAQKVRELVTRFGPRIEKL